MHVLLWLNTVAAVPMFGLLTVFLFSSQLILHHYSQVFYEKAALMNFIGKQPCRSLFFQ